MRWLAVGFALSSAVAPQTALADWRTETGVFRIGVVGSGDGLSSPGRYEAFRAEVSAAIEMPVEILVLRDAPSLIDAQTSGRVEYAVLSSLGYAAAQQMCTCLEPLVAPTSSDGATGVRSVLVARQSQEGAEGMVSGPVGYGPPGSLTGDLAPRIAFTLDDAPLEEAGLELVAQPSFEAARAAFLSGELAGLFAWDYATADAEAPQNGGLGAALTADGSSSAVIVWQSDHVPFGPHVVRDSVPEDVREALREMLVALDAKSPEAYDAISPSLGGGFVAVSGSDYAFASRLVSERAQDR